MTSHCSVVLVCFQVRPGSVIVTVDITGSGDQSSGANVTILVLQLQQDVSASSYPTMHLFS